MDLGPFKIYRSFYSGLRPTALSWILDLSLVKIYEFFYSGLRPIALPWILDLGLFRIQNPFLIKFEANFQCFFGSKNVWYIHRKKAYASKIWKIQKTQFS